MDCDNEELEATRKNNMKLGDIIKNPEHIVFDTLEIKLIVNDYLYTVESESGFINLKEIGDRYRNSCFIVIHETPLNGAIYRYNNYNKNEWQLVGKMLGYA